MGDGAARTVAVFLTVLAVGAGCSTGGGDNDATQYGYAPRPDGSIVYQPDVVFVDGGSRAIRSVSKDGLTYVIDRNARGANRLQPGKVMFLTSEAVGRVVRVAPSTGDLAVTLAPVELTEVVRDGRLVVDQEVDFDSYTFRPVPDLLGEVVNPPDGLAPAPQLGTAAFGGIRHAPRIILAAVPRARDGSSYSTKVGEWDVTAQANSSGLGLSVQHSTAAPGLVVGFDINLLAPNLRVQGDIAITNGVIPHPRFRIDGVQGIAVSVTAGASGGLGDNKNVKIEIPIELKQPILIGGFPATLKQTFKFLVQTAFSAKNATLKASGEWGLDGPVGYDGATVLTPDFSVRKSIVESLRGVSVGVDGIVIAAEFRFGLMIGLPVAGAGPYAGIVTSIGLTNGSSAGHLGLPLAGPSVKCRGATLVALARAGIGISLSSALSKAIELALNVKIPHEKNLLSTEIVNRTVVDPDVPLCRAG